MKRTQVWGGGSILWENPGDISWWHASAYPLGDPLMRLLSPTVAGAAAKLPYPCPNALGTMVLVSRHPAASQVGLCSQIC